METTQNKTYTERYFEDFTDAERLEMAKALANATPEQLTEAALEVIRQTTWQDILVPIIDGLREGIVTALNDPN
jgi:hypothetical protein